MKLKKHSITVAIANDDHFLSQDMTSAGTATSFSVANGCFPGGPQKIAFSHNHTSSVSITVVYRRPEDPEVDITETVAIANATVAYTTYAACYLTSVTWSSLAKTLKVGFQGYPYYWVGDLSVRQLVGACFTPMSSSGTLTQDALNVARVTTDGTPEANKFGFEASSNTLHYCYPLATSDTLSGILDVLYLG